MTSIPAADPLAAIEQAYSMWPYNSHAVEDPSIEAAVLLAIDKPTDAPMFTSLLRRGCQHAALTLPLFEAVFRKAADWSAYDLFAAPCDRCCADVQPRHTLWVNAGATVVDVHVCDGCRRELASLDLVWS